MLSEMLRELFLSVNDYLMRKLYNQQFCRLKHIKKIPVKGLCHKDVKRKFRLEKK